MILVTGATGLVGSHLVYELVKNGWRVRAIRRPESDLQLIRAVFRIYSEEQEELFSRIEWIEGDIMDIYSLENAMEDVEYVYHCAAIVSFHPKDHKKMLKVNVEGTANVVNAAISKGVRKLCHISSIAALGRPENMDMVIDENLVWKASRNNSMYAISKYGSEREVWRGTVEGLDAVVVNPSIILGVAGPVKGSSRLFTTVWKGLKFYPPGINGFVDVRDVVKAMIDLMESDIKNERFILNSENLKYKRLFELIAEGLGKKAPFIRSGKFIAEAGWRMEMMRGYLFGTKPLITKETARTAMNKYLYSTEKIKEAIGFEFTPLEESIKAYCEIFKSEIRK